MMLAKVKKINQYMLVIFFLLLTYHFFFDLYRGAVFKVTPYDDYAPYLLYILGYPEGYIPDSPFVYRVFSVLLAMPFYEILPVYRFSGLTNFSESYLKAVEAMAFVSYLATLLILTLVFLIVKDKLKGNVFSAIFASMMTLLLLRYTGLYNVDLIAISLICLIYYYVNNRWIYALLLFLSIGFNEKIALVFFLVMFFRTLLDTRSISYFYTIIPFFSLLLYLVVVLYFSVGGNEHQLEPSKYILSLYSNLLETLSLKGLFLNLFPFLILVMLYVFSLQEFSCNKNYNKLYFSKCDVLPLIVFFMIVHLLNVQYNAGRIIIYMFPFYLPLAVLYIQRLFENYEEKVKI